MGQKADELKAQEQKEHEELKNYPHFYRELFARVFLYWRGPKKWVAWGLLCGCIVFTLAVVGVQVILNYWMKEFYDALQDYNARRFWTLLLWFTGFAFFFISSNVIKAYLMQFLTLRWRRFMTEHYINIWLSERLYYFLQLFSHKTDNPDQRLADDLRKFTSETLTLFSQFFEAILMLSMFVGVLWQLSGIWHIPLGIGGIVLKVPGGFVIAALLYAALGTWITKKTVSPLLPLDFQNEQREGNFRYSLVRVREHGESIAFYRGEKRESARFRDLFQDIYNNGYQIILKTLRINTWLSFYGQVSIIIPALLMAPRYFAEKLPIGFFVQLAGAFGKVEESFSVIVKNYAGIISWKASTLRILTFEARLKELAHQMKTSAIRRRFIDTEDIHVHNLTLRTPGGAEICVISEHCFLKGQSVLIQGDSGVGKSSFLRGLSGLWPFGEGEIIEPVQASFFFLPQKPYLPLGSLAEVLVYPQSGNLYSTQILQELLVQVGLEKFVDSLEQVDYWPGLLSGGEQQRLAFARLLLQKPDWAFLDEATSALDEPSEKALYELLRKFCPTTTLISVGHRPSLEVFHEKTWHFPTRQVMAV